jgi:hypothetical protein
MTSWAVGGAVIRKTCQAETQVQTGDIGNRSGSADQAAERERPVAAIEMTVVGLDDARRDWPSKVAATSSPRTLSSRWHDAAYPEAVVCEVLAARSEHRDPARVCAEGNLVSLEILDASRRVTDSRRVDFQLTE